MDNSALILNPRYLSSGFRSQAGNISQTQPAVVRKLACLMSGIASHILKHGSDCYASTDRLTSLYNQNAAKFGCKMVSERTVYDLLAKAQQAKLITRHSIFNQQTGQSRRHIQILVDGVKSLFTGVYNYAKQAAEKYVVRENLQLGRSTVDKCDPVNTCKGSRQKQDPQNCRQRSKDLSKERNKNKSGAFPSDSFFVRFFGKDANTVKSLQLAAKSKRITASGAKKLIGLHAEHGFELAKPCKKFLHYVIGGEHKVQKEREALEVAAFGGTPDEAKAAANQMFIEMNEFDVAMGRAEFYCDRFGRVQLRQL